MPKSPNEDKNSTTQTEDNVINLISSARAALQNGDFDKAEEDLHLGLQASASANNFTQIPFIYDILSAMAFSKGNLGKAASILEEAVKKLIILGFPKNHYHVADFRFRLARIFSSLVKSEIAENNFHSSLEELKKEFEVEGGSQQSRLLYANLLFRYGDYKVRNSEYNEAKEIINQALGYLNFDKTPQAPFIKSISCTLSDLCNGIASDETAVEYFIDTLPLLKIPDITESSKCLSSTSKESFMRK